VETFCALRLFIDSWRWAGVPWYLAGKVPGRERCGVLVELKAASTGSVTDSAPADGRATYLRFRLSPTRRSRSSPGQASGARSSGDQRELMCSTRSRRGTTYERLLATLWKAPELCSPAEDAVGPPGQ